MSILCCPLNILQNCVLKSFNLSPIYPNILKKVKYDLYNYPNPNEWEITLLLLNYSREKLLCHYSKQNNLNAVKALVKRGAFIHTLDNLPLINAVSNNNNEMVFFLIDSGVNPNYPECFPILKSIENGNLDMVQFLLENGANIELKNYLAIETAIYHNQLDILNICILHLPITESYNKNIYYFINLCKQDNKIDRRKILEYLHNLVV